LAYFGGFLMSGLGDVVLCAFWHDWRVHFGIRVCDNLVGGVPVCVVAEFYPNVASVLEHWLAGVHVGDGICWHFYRNDVYNPAVKSGCFFGGVSCVHSDVVGFGACVGCSRFVRS
jgi:hypothetical protein